MTKVINKNIPIDKSKISRYKNVREIFENENIEKYVFILPSTLPELKNLDVSTISTEKAKELAWKIFKHYHNRLEFVNNNNKILVSKSGIHEAVYKIFAVRGQHDLLMELLIVVSNLGAIIEHATLVNQTRHLKTDKNPNVLYWSYYLDGVVINTKCYKVELDIRSMKDGKNQFRVQRIELVEKK